MATTRSDVPIVTLMTPARFSTAKAPRTSAASSIFRVRVVSAPVRVSDAAATTAAVASLKPMDTSLG
ncbi:MAG TPA: hypothetical protein VE404_02290 [Verrucomicrobiae bacterium]|nr:hypothetical protein [Verrucomicrobiae bacterium]